MKSYIYLHAIILSLALSIISCNKVNQSPSVRITNPSNGLIIKNDTLLQIAIEASDNDGYITKVELLINDTIIHIFDKLPYQYNWKYLNNSIDVLKIEAIAYDDKGAIGISNIDVEIQDFRIRYLGDFRFKVMKDTWIYGEGITYDTLFYDGLIRNYKISDSQNDLFSEDDSSENTNEKITIKFKENTKITSLINKNGVLISKFGYHYSHYGKFINIDTIHINIDGLGGQGSVANYKIIGIRKK